MICPLILNCNPQKRHLPSFPDSQLVNGRPRFPQICEIVEFLTFLEVSRVQTGSVSCVARDKNVTGC